MRKYGQLRQASEVERLSAQVRGCTRALRSSRERAISVPHQRVTHDAAVMRRAGDERRTTKRAHTACVRWTAHSQECAGKQGTSEETRLRRGAR